MPLPPNKYATSPPPPKIRSFYLDPGMFASKVIINYFLQAE